MMQIMPVTLGISKGKALYHASPGLQVGDHLFHGYIIITDGGGLPIACKAPVLQCHHQGRLMGLGTL